MNTCMKRDGGVGKHEEKEMKKLKGRLWAVRALQVTPAETWLTVYRRRLVDIRATMHLRASLPCN